MKHLGFASISAIKQYLRYAEARQLDTQHLISQANIPLDLLTRDDGRVKGANFQTLLLNLIELADDPVLGLNSSQYVQAQSYNLLGAITLNCKTIGEAIDRIPPYERLVGDMGITTIQKNQQALTLTWHCAYSEPRVRLEMIDNVLASWTQFARWLAQQKANAREVHLSRPAPPQALRDHYEKIFGCCVLFGQKENCIVLDPAILATPLHRQNAIPLNQLEGRARSQLSSLKIENESFAEQVARSIRAHLQMGSVRKELIAQEFNVSQRSIQRMLEKEGIRYQTLLRQARYERACELLLNSRLSIDDIAHNVGYSDERCFYRSFKQWSNKSPAVFREAQNN